ncbi:MAG TPA: ATP-binding protein [Candidatus Polarisedimenticolaceae bacterium]|nr:ATP-binding protein [Candidatus Polarisedimenticolaceae bacterium]
MIRARRCLPALLLLFATPSAHAVLQLPMRHYTTADGLAHDGVEKLAFDGDGFLWIGTDGGLCRFDGDRFTRFGPADGLQGQFVHDLALGKDGTHWVATDRGLFAFRPGEAAPPGRLFRAIPLEGLADQDRPYRILVDRAGTLWAGTFSHGLWRIARAGEGYRATPVAAPGLVGRVQCLAEDPAGAIWVGTHVSGIYRVRPEGGVDHCPRSVLGADFVRSFHFPVDGGVWTAFFGGVAVFEKPPFGVPPVGARVFGRASGMEIDTGEMLSLADDRVLVATTVGLIELRRSGRGVTDWEVGPTIDRRSGLPQDPVRAVALDGAGNLWLGLFNRGLVKLVRNGLSTAPAVEGGSHIVDLATDGDGRVVVLAGQGAMALTAHTPQGEAGPPTSVSLPPSLTYIGWGVGQKLLVDHLGAWWIATGAGVLRYEDPHHLGVRRLAHPPDTVYGMAEGLSGRDAYVLVEDGRGDLWISTNVEPGGDGTVSRWSRATGRIERFPAATLGTRSLALGFYPVRDAVWIPFADGTLVRFRSGGFERILEDADFADMLEDRAGRLWTSGRRPRISRAASATRPAFTSVDLATGDESLEHHCACEARDGTVWFGTSQGIAGYAPDGRPVGRLTVEDGLVGGNITLCARDGAGALWFSDGTGLSRLEAPRQVHPPLPRARVREIRMAGEAVPLPAQGISDLGALRIPADRRRLSLEFFAVHSGTGPPLRFQYRLDRGDAPWSPPARTQSVQFDELAPGRYRFLVRTVGEDGAASDAPASVALDVRAPLWQQAWFVALGLASVAGAVYIAHRVRVGRAVAVERLRTRIATDLHDDIGSSLSQIAILSQLSSRRPELQERITSLAGEVVDSMGDVVWAINPRADTVSALTTRMRRFASELFADGAVALTLLLPEEGEQEIDPDARRQLYLVFKEALHNVRRHAEAQNVRVELARGSGTWRLSVEEDGRGFDAERAAEGQGLASMRRRAERVGGTLQVASSPAGTRLVLAIPEKPVRKLFNG